MLATLRVRDLVLIDDVELEFVGGLNVLTGETGAGKSILLDALGLSTGARTGNRSTVRPGVQQGSTSAIFEAAADHPSRVLIADNGISTDGELILRRAISADGRTRAFVNDEPVGVGLLRDIGAALVEIHGQADDRGLFDTATHRMLLDRFGGHEELATKVATLFREVEDARCHADDLRRTAASAAADFDYLKHIIEELSSLHPEEGEEEKLAADRALLMNASRIAEDVSAALELLSGERGAESGLASALKRLVRLKPEAREAVAAAERLLDQSFALAEEGRRELEVFLSRLESDPRELEKKEERLFALRAAARKHAVTVEQLPHVLAGAQARLSAISSGDEDLKQADAAVARAHAAYIDAAKALSARRSRAAGELESVVASELTPLKLGHAKFRVALESIDRDSTSATGMERVAFEVATVAGAPFGPLAKIASGGELARFSLALKVALSEANAPAALVFDEVDRGIGGAVADAVGERLQRLAASTQVLLVTHSPQVAARAERHFRIARKRDRTQVELVSAEDRVEEIARMLSGAAVTEEARAAARRLLVEAQVPLKKARKRA